MLWLPSLADFLNRPTPAFLVLFELKLYWKTVGFSGIRTRIVGVEGEHADYLTNLDHHHGTIFADFTIQFAFFCYYRQ